MFTITRIPSALPTCVPSLQEPYSCISAIDLLPQLSNLTDFPNIAFKHGLENLTVGITESVATGSPEDASLGTDGYPGGGHRDCYGGYFGGRGCDLIAGNSSGARDCKTARLRTKTKVTKTTSAPKAKETDERIVNVGLVVALLGLLSVVC